MTNKFNSNEDFLGTNKLTSSLIIQKFPKFPKEIFDLDIDTLNELIITMRTYESKFNDEGEFNKAIEVNEKLKQLSLYKELKFINDINTKHENKKEILESEQQEMLKRFNEIYDSMFSKLSNDFKIDQEELVKLKKSDIISKRELFNLNYPSEPKPSNQLIKKHSELENLKKLKYYKEANIVQKEIINLTSQEFKRHQESKDIKLKKEIEIIESIYNKHFDVLNEKFASHYNELKKKRATQFEELMKRFNNKNIVLKVKHKAEIKKLDKSKSTQSKGLSTQRK